MPIIKVEYCETRDVVLPEPGHWERSHEMTDFPTSNSHWVCDDGRVFNAWTGKEEHDYKPIGADAAQREEFETWAHYHQDCERYLRLLESGAGTDHLKGEFSWQRYRGLPRDMAVGELRTALAEVEVRMSECLKSP